MSYDIDVGREWFNYTGNLAALFYDHLPAERGDRGGLHELHGLTGKQAAGMIDLAIDRIHATYCTASSTAAFRKKYDAENGWGSTDGAILFLARIAAACRRNPRANVSVSA